MIRELSQVVRHQLRRDGDSPEDLIDSMALNSVLDSVCGDRLWAALRDCMKYHELAQGAEVLAPGEESVVLLGRGAQVTARWPTRDHHTTGHLWQGDTFGFWELVNKPAEPIFSSATLTSGAGVYKATWEEFQRALGDVKGGPARRLRADLLGGLDTEARLRALGHATLLAASPAFNELLSSDRGRIAMSMVTKEVADEAVIYKEKSGPKGLYFILPGSEVTLDAAWAPLDQTDPKAAGVDARRVSLGFGSLIGLGALQQQTTISESARAKGAAKLLMLPERVIAETILDRSKRSVTQASQYLAGMGVAAAAAPAVLTALMNTPQFKGRTWQELYPVLEGWRVALWRMSSPAPSPVGDLPGIGVVVQGEVIDYVQTSGATQAETGIFGPVTTPVAVFPAGTVFGGDSLQANSMIARHYKVRMPTKIVYILARRLTDVLGELSSLGEDTTCDHVRRTLGLAALPTNVRAAVGTLWASGELRGVQLRGATTELFLIDAMEQEETAALVPYLLGGLFSAIKDDFNEVCHLLHLVPRDQAAPAAVTQGTTGGVDPVGFTRVPVGADWNEVISAVRDLLRDARSTSWNYLFIVVERPLRQAAWPLRYASQVIYINSLFGDVGGPGVRVPWPDLTHGHAPYVYTNLLPPVGDKSADGAVYPPCTARRRLDVPRTDEVRRLRTAEGRLQAGEADFHAPRHEAFARQMSRWARAITKRRVGVALSGGESWGAAHYAFLFALRESGVPIDVVSSVSVGSMFGSYYCAGGLEGIERNLLRRPRPWKWQLLNLFAMFSTVGLTGQMDRDLKPHRLETLEIPLMPMGTVLNTASPSVVLNGTVGQGIVKSGSMVPVVPPYVEDGLTWVDGAYSANLPFDALNLEGVRFVLSCNVMAPPVPQAPTLSRFQRLRDLTGTYNPINRVRALYRGVFTLAYTSGARSALEGTMSFQTSWSPTSLFNIIDLEFIVRQSLANPELWEFATGRIAGRPCPPNDCPRRRRRSRRSRGASPYSKR